jgi:hypothetical protein
MLFFTPPGGESKSREAVESNTAVYAHTLRHNITSDVKKKRGGLALENF